MPGSGEERTASPTQLELTREERDLLAELLLHELASLRQELYHSEDPDFKDGLRRTKVIVETMIDKVQH